MPLVTIESPKPRMTRAEFDALSPRVQERLRQLGMPWCPTHRQRAYKYHAFAGWMCPECERED